jgi:hypothetical protein
MLYGLIFYPEATLLTNLPVSSSKVAVVVMHKSYWNKLKFSVVALLIYRAPRKEKRREREGQQLTNHSS